MQRTFKTFTFVAAFVLIATCGLGVAAGDRVSARVDEPVSVNGETFPAGLVQIKEIRDYSPGITINEIRIGGRSVGMILAREDSGAARHDRSALLFSRDAAGTLVLDGVAVRNEPVRQLMAFRSVDGHGEWYLPGEAADGSLIASLD